MPIKTIEPEGINNFTEDGRWQKIELAVDNGPTESVVPESMPSSIPTTPGTASRRGVLYEVANGQRKPNEGEKKFAAVAEEGTEKKLVMQVCEVKRDLLSVNKASATRKGVVFDPSAATLRTRQAATRSGCKKKRNVHYKVVGAAPILMARPKNLGKEENGCLKPVRPMSECTKHDLGQENMEKDENGIIWRTKPDELEPESNDDEPVKTPFRTRNADENEAAGKQVSKEEKQAIEGNIGEECDKDGWGQDGLRSKQKEEDTHPDQACNGFRKGRR